MRAGQLWPLRIPARELVPDAVQQLHIALLRVLLQRRDKRPRHGTRGLRRNCRIRSVGKKEKNTVSACHLNQGSPDLSSHIHHTYEVWSSLLPESMITSAGDVLVARDRACASSAPPVAFLKKLAMLLVTPDRSPWLYDESMFSRPWPASLARFGSFKSPCVE